MPALLRIGALIALLLTAFSIVPCASAAEDDAAVTMARERFKEGVRYFDNKQYDKARVAFLQAYALKSHPAVLLNLAQSELRSGYEVDAAKHFVQYMREHGDASEDQRAAAAEGLAAAKEKAGELTLRVDEDDAEVWLDGEQVGRTPLQDPLYMSPGSHTLVVKKGSQSSEVTVELAAGAAETKDVKLASVAGATPPPVGEGPGTAGGSVDLEDVTSGDSSGTARILMIVGASLAVVGLGAGAGFALAAKSSYDSADSVAGQIRTEIARINSENPGLTPLESTRICTRDANYFMGYTSAKPEEFANACKTHQDFVSSGDSRKQVATVSFAVGGVGAALAIGALIYDVATPSNEAATTKRPLLKNASLTPLWAPGMGGLSLQGTF